MFSAKLSPPHTKGKHTHTHTEDVINSPLVHWHSQTDGWIKRLIHTFTLHILSTQKRKIHQITIYIKSSGERKVHLENQYIIEQLTAPKFHEDHEAGWITYVPLNRGLFSFSRSVVGSSSAVNEVDHQSWVTFLPLRSQEDLYRVATAIQTAARGRARCGCSDLCRRDPRLRGRESQCGAKWSLSRCGSMHGGWSLTCNSNLSTGVVGSMQ